MHPDTNRPTSVPAIAFVAGASPSAYPALLHAPDMLVHLQGFCWSKLQKLKDCISSALLG